MQRSPSSVWFILLAFLFLLAAYRSYINYINEYMVPVLFKKRDLKIIAAFGDSLTEGLYDWPNSRQFHPYTKQLQRLIDQQLQRTDSAVDIVVQNHGISGERLTKTMKTRLKEVIFSFRPNFVIILAGTNDLLDIDKDFGELDIHSKANEIINDMQTLHLFCHYKGIPTAILSIPETAFDDRDKNSNVSLLRKSINREMRNFVSRNNTQSIFVDISKEIPRKDNRDFWDDGVHLSPKGYDKMGSIIYRGIKKFLDDWIEKGKSLNRSSS